MKDSGRIVNAKRNMLYGFMQVIVSLALPFITRTILIYRFGVDYLGLNSLFASLLSVLSLMELGFGTAVVYSMYKPAAEGDVAQLCAYLSYYRRIYRIIGILILIVGVSIMPFLNRLVYDAQLPGGLNLYECYLIFLGDAVISYLLYGYMTAIPMAFQRRDILSRVDMCISLMRCLLQVLLLCSCSNFYIYLCSIPFFTVIRNIVIAWTVRKRFPELGCSGQLDQAKIHVLNRKVHGLVVEKITAVSRNSIDSVCISAFIGLAVNGMYNNYFYIMTSVISFSTMVLGAMMAGVGNSIAVETREKNYADMRMFDFIYTSIAGWATVCLLCLYQPFIMVWLGEGMMLDMRVVVGLCAYFYILKSGDIRWVYHEGNGLWYESRFIMIGEALVNIVLNILLCRVLGVFGIVLATVMSVFITNFFFCPWLLFRIYFRNGKMGEYLRDHLEYAVMMAGTAIVCWCVCERVLPMRMVMDGRICETGMCLCGRLVVCTLLSVLGFWAVWCRSGRYRRAVGWIARVVRG